MFKALLTILIWIMIAGIASAVQDPFLVYGYVTYDNGSLVDCATVNISVPDQALTETTNSLGKYIGVFDRYQDGDEIIVTTVKGLYTGSAADILDKSSGGLMINVTMQDTAAPRLITSLQNTVGNFWINWTWTNPDDSDFGYSEVYIDNVWTANVSDTYYNGSYPAHSIKTISIKTVDLNGNVNNTWMNQTTEIPNNPVLLTNISTSLTTAEGQTVYIDADAIDADCDGLTYSASGLPAGASFNTASGAFSWTPADGQAGTYVINFEVTDGYINDSEAVTITVNDIQKDTTPPSVTYPTAAPSIIPDDTDSDPQWGESSRLNVTVTDDDGIASVTIDLSAIDGSTAQPMANIGGNIWSVATVASAGTPPQTYDLRVNATDIYGHSNTSGVISLTVVKNGDVNNDGKVDYIGDAVYLVRHTRNTPGYEEVLDGIADVTGDGKVDFVNDAVYLVRHTTNMPGYEILH